MTRFDVIYQPKGAALEYSSWACNVVKSDDSKNCSHGCLYCYNKPGSAPGPVLKDNVLERLNKDLKKLKAVIKPGERLEYTFVGDIYDPALPDYVARRCLVECKQAGIPFQVLTKNGLTAPVDFELYGPDDLFGVTLTCDNDADSKKWEPGASLWSDRIRALKEAHSRGIRTWVSFEPVVDPAQTLHLIELVAPYVDIIKVGKLNSSRKQTWHSAEIKRIAAETDWKAFGEQAVKLLIKSGKQYYIKDDLLKFLPDGTAQTNVIITIPPSRLQNPSFRFILVAPKSKRPLEKDWQESANYPYDSKVLQNHLSNGGNYGVICGPGGLRVFDCDMLARLGELGILAKLPKTFSVRSREGRLHRYYLIPELEKKIVLWDPILKGDDGQPLHLGEIQGPGTQVIGPGSIHQTTGKPYEAIDDSPIAALSLKVLHEAIEGLKTSKAAPSKASPRQTEDDQFKNIRIEDIAYPAGETRRIGDEIQGSHPKHGSTSGKNFRIDLKKNSWYCDRCHAGGGPALWLAVQEGIISCDQAGSGALRGADFMKVVQIAESKGLIDKSGPTFKLHPKAEALQSISLEDVTESRVIFEGTPKERVERHLSPDKAAEAIIQYMRIVSTPDSRIWVYRDGVYKPDGDLVIDQILDRVCGDLYTIRGSSETKKKVVLRTSEEYNVFDSDPYLFGVANGVVDMRNGRFVEHSPDFYLTMKAPVKYDPKAQCPAIKKFLGASLGTVDNVLSALDLFTAKTTDLLFEYFVAMIGGGSNGKSKFQELIRAFFGDDCIAEVELATLTQNRFDRKELHKKRFLINSEVSGDAKESRWLKYISGGGRLDADQKNRDHFQFRPRCLIIFDTNNPPRFSDNSYGFQRRLVKIDFPNSFVDEPKAANERKKDPFLLEKITTQEELSGLLNLLIMRAVDVIPGRKIHRRATGQNLAEEYDMQSNSVASFFDMFCEFDNSLWCSKSQLYEKYRAFCQKINAVPVSAREFNKFAARGLKLEEKRKETPAGFIRIFWGINIMDDIFDDFTNEGKITSYVTRSLPDNSLSLPGLPTLPGLREIIVRIIEESIGGIGSKNPVNPVNAGTDSEKGGKKPDAKKTGIESDLARAKEETAKKEEHDKTPRAWMCCSCGRLLTQSEVNEFNDEIYCFKCCLDKKGGD